ncbi:hypothetical protein CMI44_01800 [Candidatus Pacearchaeota archaeon]|nr:hypothetical protein [Candidatus Pacearchaeota archaeon]|tara:strand:+ start:376 stop:885 length:510 start_codon:yes stop_codon:yes gene_type:complete
MSSIKQRRVAKKNIKKAQKKWKSMSSRQRALAQPQGRARKKPGTTGKGKFYRIIVRPKSEFVSFRNQDIGKKGHLQRLAGRRSSGSWATHSWLIAKTDAEMKNKTLIGKTKDARTLLSKLRTKPKRIRGDIFEAKDRKNIPESSKPTSAMKKAQSKNILKAIAARWKKR